MGDPCSLGGFLDMHTAPRPKRRLATGLIVALIVGLLPMLAPTTAAAATVSETEPNATRATADAFALTDTMSASSLSTSSQDIDYFAVDLPSAGRVALDLRFPSGLGGDAYEVQVATSDGHILYDFPVSGLRSDGSWLRSKATYAPAGRLYVRVNGRNNWETWGRPYTLAVGFTAGNVETEPNATRNTPDVLALGQATAGSSLSSSSYDDDYYAVDVPSPSRVTLDLRFPAGLGGDAYEVTVYDSSGSFLYEFDVTALRSDGSWLRAKATYAPAGRLFLRIRGNESWETWGQRYTIRANVTPGNVETESNANFSTPDVLTLGKATSASSLSIYSYDYDVFAVDLDTAARVSLKLTFPSGLGAGDVYEVDVYDPSKARIHSFALTGSRSSGTWLASQSVSLPAGRSYVRVYGSESWPSWGRSYQLSVTRALTKTPTPSISGTARIGKTLKAKPGTWGPGTVTLKYQWLRGGKAISGATKTSYKLTSKDKGAKISVKVTGSRSGYATVSKTSTSVTALYSFTRTPKPTISGTAKVGKKVTAKAGTWSPKATLTYRWLRNGTAISGATKKTYTLTSKDKGKKISVKVTAKKKYYATVAKTSATKKIS